MLSQRNLTLYSPKNLYTFLCDLAIQGVEYVVDGLHNGTLVQSLLGLLNSFKNFIPDMTQLLPNIRSLHKKDTEFQWTEQCEQEFREIKEIISGPLG